MFIYNITNKVNISIADEWLQWQREEHIPEIISTNLFTEFKIFRLLDQDDIEGITYIIQYFTLEKDKYETYLEKFAPALREKAINKWGERFIAFRSLLQSVK